MKAYHMVSFSIALENVATLEELDARLERLRTKCARAGVPSSEVRASCRAGAYGQYASLDFDWDMPEMKKTEQ